MSDLIEVVAERVSGPALDYCVFVANGKQAKMTSSGVRAALGGSVFHRFSPTSDSRLASEQIINHRVRFDTQLPGFAFSARIGSVTCGGDTIDIAACRAIVAAKLGCSVQVPKELIPQPPARPD